MLCVGLAVSKCCQFVYIFYDLTAVQFRRSFWALFLGLGMGITTRASAYRVWAESDILLPSGCAGVA